MSDPSLDPAPAVMPVDRDLWFKQLGASNFNNSYCEYRDIQSLKDISRILVVGPGQGLDVEILRWRGYSVTTMDIDEKFSPDFVGSVHELHMFRNKQFDVVIASHVLEHLPVKYLRQSMGELSRVARYALVYLPVAGRHFQFRLKLDVKGVDVSVFIDLYNYFHRPDGITPKYCEGQHFWEIGYRGFRVQDIRRRLEEFFHVQSHYRNAEWNPSYNFVLKSKACE